MSNGSATGTVIGIDLGDRFSQVCVLEGGEGVERERLATTRKAFEQRFRGERRSRIVLEVGTHSPWSSRLLRELGHEVVVANPRRVLLISRAERKTDRVDAETLARLGNMDVKLLAPIEQRSQRRAELIELASSALQNARVAASLP
jgi:transposase